MKKIIVFLLAFSLIWTCSSCKSRGLKRYEAQFLVLFDTMTTIIGYEESREEFAGYVQEIYDSLEASHRLYDIYNDYDGFSNLKTINDNAGITPVKVDRRIIDLLLFAKEEYAKTQGKMNIAFGSVLEIWHEYRMRGTDDPQNAEVPSAKILREAGRHTDISQVIIDEKASTVFLNDPKMRLDAGAIAKGYAVEQAARVAVKNGFHSGLISVGGNVRAIGRKNGSDALWNVGVEDPNRTDGRENLLVAYLSDMSLVTSGDYERYYMVGGQKYHHIIDPKTLFPSGYFTAVTVLCKDSGAADALSTGVFNMPFEQGLALIESMPDTEALWVFKNGEIKYSAGFEAYMER